MKNSSSKQLPHTEHFIMDFITSMLSPQLPANAQCFCAYNDIMWCSGVGVGACVFSGLNRHERIQHTWAVSCLFGLNYKHGSKEKSKKCACARTQERKWKCIQNEQQQQVQQSKTNKKGRNEKYKNENENETIVWNVPPISDTKHIRRLCCNNNTRRRKNTFKET